MLSSSSTGLKSFTKTPKKINKTTRLTKSLDISNSLVHSVDQRNEILNNYYTEKINYLKKNLEMKEKTLTVLTEIKTILKNTHSSN